MRLPRLLTCGWGVRTRGRWTAMLPQIGHRLFRAMALRGMAVDMLPHSIPILMLQLLRLVG